ncbi:hypothetical protein MRB53_000603 [Persea americana]|uniref:Uncharacterized protein n=1 Tax=Persea americana TaxID=3435 RepID=A0ACC2MPK3_PERAE|nr:hypothetical protein MRB53_000603 [Persea americana]
MTTAILTARFHELLRKCTHINMSQVKQIQAHLTTSGLLFFDVRLLGRLFSVAAGDLSHAHLLLSQIPHHHKNIFFYNTLIRSHSQTPAPQFAISIYVLSLRAGLLPDSYTFPLLLKACSLIPACPQGQSAHGQSLKLGLYPSLFLNNALIHFYSLTGQIHIARQLFDESPLRDVVSWNSMINGYARTGDMGKARELFDEMPERNVISWSALIAGYVQVGLSKEALDAFVRMQAGPDRPNEATLVSVLAACAHLGALEQGKWAHGYLKSSGMSLNVFVGTALIDMYGKCGEIDLGLEVFSEMEEKNLLAWTAMIKGLAMHGRGSEALSLFASMDEAGVVPDDITFIGVLCACTHAGLVDEGRRIFNSMNEVFGIMPKIEHYGCMVDLLARVGLLEEARRLVEQMPMEPDVLIWGALMAGCRFHGDVGMAEYVGKHLIELEPDNGAVFVLLANIYSVSGRHDNAQKVWQLMKSKGLMKTPGCSSIEIRGTVHQFLVGDTSHPQIREILAKWEEIERLMKLEGYVSNKMDVLLDIEEEEKEEVLARHSEKLAVAFGLISTSTGTVIHIVKNLRVCNDCHHVTKLISKVYNREIIVRDRTRFHHFKGGTCNCKDYW